MASPFFVTTPIYYVNARPHLGHAYTTIVTDVARRFHKIRGQEAYMLTGTDEHGDKIVEAAEKEHQTPKEYVDKISKLFSDLWPDLTIGNDQFIRTTYDFHKKVVQDVLQKIYDKGEIYFAEYEGLYCFGCERFYQERELVDGKCPDHQTEPEVIKESNYFFKMSKYQNWLIDHINNNPGFIRPKRYANEVLAFLREPLEDLCISRPKTRLEWGVELPFDDKYVTYVWFDALLNYVSALGYPDGELFQKYWPAAHHVTAKDILKPHGIYWPCMLQAAEIPVYQHLSVHGYWNVSETKMSKSLGNVVEPLEMAKKYGVDAFRYFLLRDMVFGLDSSFSEDALVGRINSDLANDLGNLFSRVLSMAKKYRQGVVPAVDGQVQEENSLGLAEAAKEALAQYDEAMDQFEFHKGLMATWDFISRMNKYVDSSQPWTLAKEEADGPKLDAVLYNLMEGMRLCAVMAWPIMPEKAAAMYECLGLDPALLEQGGEQLFAWGGLVAGGQTSVPKALFPRIDVKKKEKNAPKQAKKKKSKSKKAEPKPQIDIDTVKKLDLRVGEIIAAEAIPKADRLLKLTVDLGEETPRTLVAGIAKAYSPDDVVGKQVVVVANLAPASLMGVESQGMVLAAVDKKGARLLALDRPAPVGTPVS